MNGFKFRRCYDTKLNLYRYNNQAVFNLTNDLLDFLIISKSKIKNFKLHRYASFIPTWITKESALLFKEVVNTDDVRDSVFYPWNYPQWSMNHGKLHNGVRRNGMIRFSINLQNEMFKYIHICGRDKRSENRFSFLPQFAFDKSQMLTKWKNNHVILFKPLAFIIHYYSIIWCKWMNKITRLV